MKKTLAFLMLLLALITGCKSQMAIAEAAKPPVEGKVKYEYKAYARGSRMEITLDDRLLSGSKTSFSQGEQRIAPSYVTQGEWEYLLLETGKIELDKLEELEVTSKRHQFDGAPAATLIITIDSKAYASVTFDHGNPPDEIKPLVEKIIELSKLETK